jgi:predicted O-methyltransferase YrrM
LRAHSPAPASRIAPLLLGALAHGCAGTSESVTEPPRPVTSGEVVASQGYVFSSDWFTENIPIWTRLLADYQGKPGIRYLEVGVFEGRSMVWMVENILTHPTAEIVGIDPFDETGELKARFDRNLAASGFRGKAHIIVGLSQSELGKLPANHFDIIYIDGSHTADDVLTDAVLAWPLVKEGGVIIFDDYLWPAPYPDDLLPKIAVDSFVNAYWKALEVVHSEYQLVIRKRKDPGYEFMVRRQHTTFGQYVYLWDSHTLFEPKERQQVMISDAEQKLIERIIREREFGQAELRVSGEIAADATFRELQRRIGLQVVEGEIVVPRE